MTGNTWDIIKIQTKTNQLMMGNRKDHIRVRGQRQRKTKSDRYHLRKKPFAGLYVIWIISQKQQVMSDSVA